MNMDRIKELGRELNEIVDLHIELAQLEEQIEVIERLEEIKEELLEHEEEIVEFVKNKDTMRKYFERLKNDKRTDMLYTSILECDISTILCDYVLASEND